MKRKIFQLTFLLYVLLSSSMISNAQEKKTENLCLALKEQKVFFPNNQILVIGEVSHPNFLKIKEEPPTLMESIAMVGGISRKANKNFQILKCSQDFTIVEKSMFVNYQEIRRDSKKDAILEGGNIVIVRKGNEKGLPKNYLARKGGKGPDGRILY